MLLKNKTVGAALLISGTCIGAGMLAIPTVTASAGFLASITLISICWLAMWFTGLYVLEANLPLPEGANFISMAGATLGRSGKNVAWVVYVLLLYSLMAAYLSGGGGILINAVHDQLHENWHPWLGPIPWVILVGLIVYLGLKTADGLNRLLIAGLVITFILLIFFTGQHIHVANLHGGHPWYIIFALPVIFAAFGYHVIVPSLRNYLKANVSKLTKIIFWGSFLTFIVYLIWDTSIFGVLNMASLMGINKTGQPAVHLSHALASQVNNKWLVSYAEFFVFFAIASSFLGISLSLFDFLADGFGIAKTKLGRLWVALLTFVPPLIYSWLFPEGFILALSYAGVFVAILHGILPALMVWSGRSKQTALPYQAPAGKIGMVLILLLSLLVIITQIYSAT